MSIHSFSRRGVILAAAAVLSTPASRGFAAAGAEERQSLLRIAKDPGCGCCSAWADLAIAAGFRVQITDTGDYAGMKRAAEVPEKLWSCHTARVGGYIVEGHVPFAAIRQVLEQRPDIRGIAVPGMPAGSPGMGGGVDATADVIAWGGVAGDGRAFPLDG
ncbi:DUF411 domain-containing protein [Paracoccus pacificus]|uniref:DUF411 domain-containing protein n=1 Tax=Paracoccus pacificus TaxID=1463598 RepID=A0ABW4R4X0_9RHOB